MNTSLKRSFFLGIILLWFGTHAPAGAVQTGVLTVCPAGCDYPFVQAAVNAAASGDTIQILMTTPLTEADIVVNKDVTIEGLGRTDTIVQAAATSGTAGARVFTILAGYTVTMRDFTVRHGRVPNANGGGIWVRAGAELALENVDVLLNEAVRGGGIANEGTLTLAGAAVNMNTAGVGGGLFAAGGSLSLRDVVIAENNAGIDGGGIYAVSGSIEGARLFLRGNRAEDSCGGGIAVVEQATLALAQSAFVFNVAFYGGGICQSSADSAVYLTNVTLAANEANGSGGGIIAGVGVMWLANVTVTGNSAGLEPGPYYGGGIYITGGDVHLRSAIVALNLEGSGYPDCHGTFTTATFSLIGDRGQTLPLCGWSGFSSGMLADVDPQMGIIPVTGYDTVRSLDEGSPAIDAGLCIAATGPAPTTDQRGYIVPWDGDGDGDAACDMGAYEYGSQPANRLLVPLVAR